MTSAWPWLALALAASLVGTGLARAYALRRRLIDLPDDARRNHRVATPRGGGIAIVIVLCLAATALALRDAAWWPVLAGLVLVGGIGWWDDHRPLPALARLAVHGVAALLLGASALASGLPVWLCVLAAAAALVLINIWNFMDGIDGIAATQAAVVAGVCGMLAGGAGQAFAFAVVGAALGFLPWNFPKARIFMGDAGSGALGYALAVAWLGTAMHQPPLAWLPLFPLAAFLIDAGLTLSTRVLQGERWWEAHSRHSYQILSRRLGHHVPVTLLYLGWTVAGAGLVFILRWEAQWMIGALVVWWVAGMAAWHGLRRKGGTGQGV